MSLRPRSFRSFRLPAALTLVAVSALILPAAALAAPVVTLAQLNKGQLRLEGTAKPNATITVDGTALGAADARGGFKIVTSRRVSLFARGGQSLRSDARRQAR